MRKVIAIICILCMGLVLFISGCTEQDNSGTNNNNNAGSTSSEINKFIGTWDGGSFETSIEDKDKTWTFYENGSLKMVDNQFDDIAWGTYEIDETGELCIRETEYQSLMCYVYAFSDNDNQFTLTLGGTILHRFAKSE